MTVSYFEWVQDLNRDHWSEAVVNAKLKEIMVKAFGETLAMAQREEVNMRTAAYLLAVKRVAGRDGDARPLSVIPRGGGGVIGPGTRPGRSLSAGRASVLAQWRHRDGDVVGGGRGADAHAAFARSSGGGGGDPAGGGGALGGPEHVAEHARRGAGAVGRHVLDVVPVDFCSEAAKLLHSAHAAALGDVEAAGELGRRQRRIGGP